MKKAFTMILVGVVAATLFALLVHAVLVAAHVSNSSSSGATVQGLTPRRIWALVADGLRLAAVLAGSMSLMRSAHQIGNRVRNGAILALAVGIVKPQGGLASDTVAIPWELGGTTSRANDGFTFTE